MSSDPGHSTSSPLQDCRSPVYICNRKKLVCVCGADHITVCKDGWTVYSGWRLLLRETAATSWILCLRVQKHCLPNGHIRHSSPHNIMRVLSRHLHLLSSSHRSLPEQVCDQDFHHRTVPCVSQPASATSDFHKWSFISVYKTDQGVWTLYITAYFLLTDWLEDMQMNCWCDAPSSSVNAVKMSYQEAIEWMLCVQARLSYLCVLSRLHPTRSF